MKIKCGPLEIEISEEVLAATVCLAFIIALFVVVGIFS